MAVRDEPQIGASTGEQSPRPTRLAGTGTEEASLRALAVRLGVQDAVRFAGFRDDVPDLTAALDVSVLASIDWHDWLGGPVPLGFPA